MLDQALKESKLSWNDIRLPILAIDYGEKRIGLAVSDKYGQIGSPLSVITRSRKKKLETVISEISSISEEYGVGSYLLGMPYAFEEPHKRIQAKIKEFADRLAHITQKEIYYYTEAFSSKDAASFLSEYTAVGSKDGKIDKMSAALFLQNFLDARERNKNKYSGQETTSKQK